MSGPMTKELWRDPPSPEVLAENRAEYSAPDAEYVEKRYLEVMLRAFLLRIAKERGVGAPDVTPDR